MTVTVSFSTVLPWLVTGIMDIATNVGLVVGTGAVVTGGACATVVVAVEDAFDRVTVINSVDMAVKSGWKVVVMVLVT